MSKILGSKFPGKGTWFLKNPFGGPFFAQFFHFSLGVEPTSTNNDQTHLSKEDLESRGYGHSKLNTISIPSSVAQPEGAHPSINLSNASSSNGDMDASTMTNDPLFDEKQPLEDSFDIDTDGTFRNPAAFTDG
jgi:hypothetical protein